MTITPHAWQEPAIDACIHSLDTYGVFANASEMGLGKTVITCFAAKRTSRKLLVICPKSVVPDWIEWGARIGVDVTATSPGKVRTGKTPHGTWQVKGKYFKWNVPPNTDLVFDEAHEYAGLRTQQAELLCAAKRQKLRLILLSGTLLENPLKGRALGYALGLHNLIDYWNWAKRKGVVEGFFGMEWPYLKPGDPTARAKGERIMEGIRADLGDRFLRLRKIDLPGFPEKQVIPILLPTKALNTDNFESGRYGYESRMAAELLKVPGMSDRTRDLLDGGHNVALFVNYIDTLNALREEFPDAAIVCGGQSAQQRLTDLARFQSNQTNVIIIITQAGGTGVSLHDLHGRPRTSIISPGTSASKFLQAIDRIHRDGAKSHATIYVAFASGIPSEVRSRELMEAKINNLAALNDGDLDPFPTHAHTKPNAEPDAAPGALPQDPGTALPERSVLPDQCPVRGPGHPHDGPGGSLPGPSHDCGAGGPSGYDSHPVGPGPSAGAPVTSGHHKPGSGGLVDASHAPTTVGPGGGEVGRPPAGGPVLRPTSERGPGETDQLQEEIRPATQNGVETMVRIIRPPTPVAGPGSDRTETRLNEVLEKVVKQPGMSPTASAPVGDILLDSSGNYTAHVVRKHARCSPSKLKNLELCPSYSGDNDGPVHPVTLRGTAMHEALETGNDAGLLTEKDNEELRLVTACREFQDAEAVVGEVVITEPHLKTHDPDVSGFADRVVLEPRRTVSDTEDGPTRQERRARVRDYKMGWNAVDAPNDNPQAIAYTVAVFLQYPDVTEVDFAFLIPRLDLILQHTFQRSELDALKLRLSTTAERVRKLAGKEFNVVDSNCLYCGNKAHCAALHAKVLTIARNVEDAAKLPLPAVLEPGLMTDPQQVAYALNAASVVEGWIEQVRKQATAFRRDNGVEIPGYDWIERSAPRTITNPTGAFELVTKEFGVTPEAFLSAAKISITQLSAVVADAAPKGEKAIVEERLTDRLLDTMCASRGASFHVLQKTKKKAPKKTEALPQQ